MELPDNVLFLCPYERNEKRTAPQKCNETIEVAQSLMLSGELVSLLLDEVLYVDSTLHLTTIYL